MLKDVCENIPQTPHHQYKGKVATALCRATRELTLLQQLDELRQQLKSSSSETHSARAAYKKASSLAKANVNAWKTKT